MKNITSFAELELALKQSNQLFLLLYKGGGGASNCAANTLNQEFNDKEIAILGADVNKVRDIHGKYGITSVPSLLSFKEKMLSNVIKGCQTKEYYKSLFEGNAVSSVSNTKSSKSVVVYTTPTCSYCTAIKNYLAANGVQYREIDVSRDMNAAQEMVRRSGQQGVPQTVIDGKLVIGYDKKKIDELLELNSK